MRVLVVTGAASGIGLETARQWVREGGQAVLLDVDSDKLEQAREELGGNATILRVDVGDAASVDGAFARIAEEFGRVDALVTSAGGTRPRPSAEMSDEDWAAVMDIHVTGALRACRAAYPLLKEAGGAVVNLASVAAVLGMPGRANYNAAKHAIVGLTKSLAVEWAPDGIRVNAVGPGYVETQLTRTLVDEGALDPEPTIARTPLKRWAQTAEIADGILFLLSARASYITGHTLMIDGGMSIDGAWYR
ncbi:SDR family NAD(P)-dependent oxidoreductase [Corynebacterium timonense]|uniref:NAD(P)-dependent dehydrogenase, short-chain alcohol dehydrogenase family n=1 Tax=Corynebacterium timonense TaxID=441500 RepID=A0A1H1UYV0_9CORY|nr:SDR family NAD(P)-dependent oxidoreductase [Corynebacterium timonense]SDS77276.1 NAD(P)-dependent dehydrogenase, short-chain alcohol dehydrogenase family [Corynebacterium timonense]